MTTSKNSDWLLRNISNDRLEEMYTDEDYYWYLRSSEFANSFLKPIAKIVNGLGLNCLDVGCGEGQLSEFITQEYCGIDGSENAIAKARENYPQKKFEVSRIEQHELEQETFGTVIFGGILDVLVKPEHYVDFLKYYLSVWPLYFVIYDLSRLNTTEIDKTFSRLTIQEGNVNLKGIPDVKKKRKILLYSTRKAI